MSHYLHIHQRRVKSFGLLLLYLLSIVLTQVVIEGLFSTHKSILNSFVSDGTAPKSNQKRIGAFTFTLKHDSSDKQIKLPSPQVMSLLLLTSLFLFLCPAFTGNISRVVYTTISDDSDTSRGLYLRHRTIRI
jgi:hypothetical protein